MTALALSLPAPSSLTGDVRYGVAAGVCPRERVGVTGVGMNWFGHASITANPRRLDRQDRQHDMSAGVREDGDTR
jgi:hypothetical protein